MNHEIARDGFSIVRGVFGAAEREALLTELGPVSGAGRRGLLAIPAVARLARDAKLLNLARPHLPNLPVAVRAIYFDKSADANWLVPWHQDLTLAVRSVRDIPGFGPWSIKAGIPHVQPPVELLGQMLAIRLHFDDTDETNGALRVLPGTHRHGRLSAGRIQEFRSQQLDSLCRAAAGDVLLMRPLLLHASGRTTNTRPRRILHLEYAGFKPPEGLDWHEAALM